MERVASTLSAIDVDSELRLINRSKETPDVGSFGFVQVTLQFIAQSEATSKAVSLLTQSPVPASLPSSPPPPRRRVSLSFSSSPCVSVCLLSTVCLSIQGSSSSCLGSATSGEGKIFRSEVGESGSVFLRRVRQTWKKKKKAKEGTRQIQLGEERPRRLRSISFPLRFFSLHVYARTRVCIVCRVFVAAVSVHCTGGGVYFDDEPEKESFFSLGYDSPGSQSATLLPPFYVQLRGGRGVYLSRLEEKEDNRGLRPCRCTPPTRL